MREHPAGRSGASLLVSLSRLPSTKAETVGGERRWRTRGPAPYLQGLRPWRWHVGLAPSHAGTRVCVFRRTLVPHLGSSGPRCLLTDVSGQGEIPPLCRHLLSPRPETGTPPQAKSQGVVGGSFCLALGAIHKKGYGAELRQNLR